MYRSTAALCLGLTLVCAPAVVAQGEADERYTFTVANAPESGLGDTRRQVTIKRWSDDGERDRFSTLLAENDPAAVRYGLRNSEAVGYLRWPGGVEYTLRYARRIPRSGGGADLIFLTDSRVWVWWDAKVEIPLDAPFTVIHVRVDKNGVGEGKVAPRICRSRRQDGRRGRGRLRQPAGPADRFPSAARLTRSAADPPGRARRSLGRERRRDTERRAVGSVSRRASE